MIGIYKITNIVNNKVYIGQSIDISRRWSEHKSCYNKEYREDYNNHLYSAMRKYGIDNFQFDVIEECQKEELDDKEIYWISYYDSFNESKGYNMTKGGQLNGFSNPAIPIYQFDLEGNFIREWPSIREAARSLGYSDSFIGEAANGKTPSAAGFLWSLDRNDKKTYDPKRQQRTVYQYDLNGKLLNEYSSISEASNVTKIDTGSITNCCNNIRKSSCGFMWSYEKRNDLKYIPKEKPTYQYNINGNFIASYDSVAQAADKTNSCAGHIADCCRGERQTANGFMWLYEYKDHLEPINYVPHKRKVSQYDLDDNFIASYESYSEASRMTGCDAPHISDCCHGKRRTCGGFKWKMG